MLERDAIFRDRLVGLMSALNGAEGKDKKLRRTIGAYARRLFTEAGARSWVDLKERADGPTYDSMLKLFQTQSEIASKSGDTHAVRTFEVLAISLIARRQTQADLLPGISFLDKFIDGCVSAARRSGTGILPIPRTH